MWSIFDLAVGRFLTCSRSFFDLVAPLTRSLFDSRKSFFDLARGTSLYIIVPIFPFLCASMNPFDTRAFFASVIVCACLISNSFMSCERDTANHSGLRSSFHTPSRRKYTACSFASSRPALNLMNARNCWMKSSFSIATSALPPVALFRLTAVSLPCPPSCLRGFLPSPCPRLAPLSAPRPSRPRRRRCSRPAHRGCRLYPS